MAKMTISDTWLQVANAALARIDKETLESLDDGSQTALAVNSVFVGAAESVLSLRPWKSARKRAKLAPLSETPSFGFEHQYQLPSDFIELVECLSPCGRRLANDEWEREGDRILSDSSPLLLIYTALPDGPRGLSPHLRKAIVCQLAYELAIALTSDSTTASALQSEAQAEMSLAMLWEDGADTDEGPGMHSWQGEIYGCSV